MFATPRPDALQLQTLPVFDAADAPLGQQEPMQGGNPEQALPLKSSAELLQTDISMGREQAHYLRQVLQMTPEELAQNLQQLQATQAQLTFEQQKVHALNKKMTSVQMQWQGVGAGLMLLCVLLLLWGWRNRRLAQRLSPPWHASALPQIAMNAAAGQAIAQQTYADASDADSEQDAENHAAAEARVSEIWTDSQDWLQQDKMVEAAAFKPLESQPPSHSLSAPTPPLMPAQTSWRAWAPDAQPQQGQNLVDYLRSLRRMLLRLVDAGRLADARSLLYAHICLVPASSPWAYMAYFALQTTENPNWQDVRQRFEQQFDRPAPAPSEYQHGGALQRGLLDYQYSLTQLSQAWPTERAVSLLESWLSPDKRRSFTLQAYDDLFVLYDVLDQLHGIRVGSSKNVNNDSSRNGTPS